MKVETKYDIGDLVVLKNSPVVVEISRIEIWKNTKGEIELSYKSYNPAYSDYTEYFDNEIECHMIKETK